MLFILVFLGVIYTSSAKPYLLLANRLDVQLIDAAYSANSTIVQNGLEDAAALDFCYKDKSVFWTDVSLAKIKRTWIERPKNAEDIIVSGLVSPDGLACDWIAEKLYWADSETNRLEVSNLNGSFRSVLFWEELDQPRAIALDPLTGWMFWTDWGEVPKIERAGMDGDRKTRSIIIDKNIHWPNGLTIDYADNKIYWADAKVKYIASCDYDGKNHREVVAGEKILSHPFALTLSDRTLFWTDWQERSIFSCDKITGSNIRPIMENIYSPMDIHVFSASRQPSRPDRHPCTINNGGCSHLCLISPKKPFFACACPTGVKLLNKTTCAKGVEQLLLLARRRDIRKISLDMPDHTDVVLPLNEIKHAIAIDYDPVEDQVYWTDDEVRAIKRAYLDGTGEEVVIRTGVYHPDGIAVDWIARNLYWTDTGTDRIEVARLNGTSRRVLISDDLDEPRAIALDPAAGQMYWSDWGKVPKIEVANLDGSSRQVLINSSLGWPNGLAIDIHATPKKLYWGDAKHDKIEVSDVDGTNRIVLVDEKQNIPHLFGFSLLGDYIYWTDWQRRSIERVNKHNGTDRKVIVDQLPDLMGLKAVSVFNYSGTNPCAHYNGGCSHLCLYTADQGVVCACPMGLELVSNGKTCIVPEAFLLFTSHHDIKRMSLETNHRIRPIPIKGVKTALAIDFHIADDRIYWTDGDLKRISRAFLNGSALEPIVQYGLTYPEGIAVDWVAKNIYWIDTGMKRRIEVARLDGSSRRVIIWKDLESPRALAVNPPDGYIYWTDWSTQKLERAALDGTMRETIRTEIGQVHGLTIDYGEKRLYWTSLDQKVIASSDLNGQDMVRVITDQVPQPMGLTLYHDFIFWADWQRQTIERANKSSGTNRTTIQSSIDNVRDILVFHSSRQSGINSCKDNNGECSHLCLAHPVNHSSGTTHHCACPTHFRLNVDNKTCSAPKTFLLFSQKNTISRLVINNDDFDPDTPEVVLPIPQLKNIKALSYDPVEHFLYWIEGKNMVIKKAAANGTLVSTVVTNQNGEHRPFDIAVDPYSRVLYWTCAKKNTINITGLDGTPVGVIVEGDHYVPRYIVLNPLGGHMYWTDMGSHPSIIRASMDGTARIKLFDSELDRPGPLAIDIEGNKLYWADSRLHRIECSDLSGGNRKNLVDQDVSNPRGMAIFGNFLYWIDRQQHVISRVEKTTGKNRSFIQGRLESLSDLLVARDLVSEDLNHPCAKNKGECSHICVPDNAGKARCSCPLDLMLKQDDKTCADPPTCSPEQFTCESGELHCIPTVWRCDGTNECADGSDEKGCPICHTHDEFKCDIDHCISIKHVCDGEAQCLDHTDESNCDPHSETTTNCKDDHCPATEAKSSPSKVVATWTIVIVVGLLAIVLVFVFVFACRRRTPRIIYEDRSDMSQLKPLNSLPTGETTLNTLSSHGGKSHETGLSSVSMPMYDRNHVTGASSSSSTVTQYPKETLNPPPSPVTDRSVYAGAYSGYSSNSPSTVRSYRPYKLRIHNIPPPPTTPCSTDVCEESEPYCTKKYYHQSISELYSYDPYPPLPTPYFSDDMSGPPSPPSTERSFFNPYPPPPSPVAESSDC